MSLLSEAFEDFQIWDRTSVTDGVGGKKNRYTPGAVIQAVAVLNSSMEARIGQASGVSSVYTITTGRTAILEKPDVVERLSDGKTFKITSDGTDNKTPPTAGLDMRQVSAEEWSIPNGEK